MRLYYFLQVGILLILLAPAFTWASSQTDVRRIAKAGAPELAISIINRFQPAPDRSVNAWTSWEKNRLEILSDSSRWSDLIERVDNYPEDLPADFQIHADMNRANALLETGNPNEALAVYRVLLWREDINAAEPKVRRTLRYGVIQAHLGLDDIDSALTAWRRFTQDYNDLTAPEKQLRARLALRAGHPDEALLALKDVSEAEAIPLRLLAEQASGKKTPKQLIAEVEKSVAQLNEKGRAQLWWIAAQAARDQKDGTSQISYLQKALQHSTAWEQDRLFPLKVDSLWDAYVAYGEYLGNRNKLLIGDDAAWIDQAGKEKDAIRQQALFAVVALEGQTGRSSSQGHAAFIQSLSKQQKDTRLISNLYLNSAHFPTITYIPEPARPLLAEQAVEQGNNSLASELMKGLSTIPEGADPFDWDLRRARIHVLGGDEDLGIDILYGLLGRYKSLEKSQADRFLQVLFDLQTLKRDREAIALFTAMQPRLTEQKQYRELLFWMADSYKSMGQYEQAGYLYLQSALLVDGVGLDPWGQTARFFAAENLAKAGLVEDARTLYLGLIRVASDNNRKVVLRQRIQQLHLLH